MSDPSHSPDRRRQIESLFEAALDLPPEARAAFLDSSCAGDADLRAEVAALLEAHDLPAGILEREPQRLVGVETAPLSPGDRVGGYAVIREVGKGGMATVYLAEDDRRGRRVALKVLHPGLGALFGHERFKREIRLAARLHHPHILPLHDSGEAEGRLWYAMPYIEGGSLRDRLRRDGPLSVADAVRVARQVAEALDYAHREGVIHRDVKPENLLVTREGEVLVADFGIGRVFDASSPEATLTRSGMMIGTPAYMSPEQATAAKKLDGRTDIYSLGCVLYELLTGAAPYAGGNAQWILAAHLNDPVPGVRRVRPEVPARIEAALRRAMAKAPERRYGTARRFADAIEIGRAGAARPARVAGIALLASGAIAGAYLLAGERPAPAPAARAAELSLAVLPLANLSREPDDEILASGMADQLTTALAEVPGLRVAARTSAFAVRDRPDLDAPRMAQRLNVAHLLEGTLRRRGDSLRVSVALVDAGGLTVWTESYEREAAAIFDLQDEIARKVTGSLRAALPPPAPLARPATLPAHGDYLRGRHLLTGASGADLRRAVHHFRLAIDADTGYAPAWSGLAAAWILLADDHAPPREAYPEAKAAARRALQLDSTLADAYATLGGVQLWHEWDFAGARRSLERAIALDPNASLAFHYYAHLLGALGLPDSALVAAERAVLLDPLSGAMAQSLAHVHEARGHPARAVEACDPDRFTGAARDAALTCRARALLAMGAPSEALHLLDLHPGLDADLAERTRFGAYLKLGRVEAARQILARLEARAGRQYVKPDVVAELHAALGDRDAAFRWLERAYELGAGGMVFLTTSPWWDPIRGDPRFQDMVRRVRGVGGV